MDPCSVFSGSGHGGGLGSDINIPKIEITIGLQSSVSERLKLTETRRGRGKEEFLSIDRSTKRLE